METTEKIVEAYVRYVKGCSPFRTSSAKGNTRSIFSLWILTMSAVRAV